MPSPGKIARNLAILLLFAAVSKSDSLQRCLGDSYEQNRRRPSGDTHVVSDGLRLFIC